MTKETKRQQQINKLLYKVPLFFIVMIVVVTILKQNNILNNNVSQTASLAIVGFAFIYAGMCGGFYLEEFPRLGVDGIGLKGVHAQITGFVLIIIGLLFFLKIFLPITTPF